MVPVPAHLEVTSAKAGLDALAEAITQEHVAATMAHHSALRHALRAGELLLAAKDRLPHGSWLRWLRANTPVTARMSQLYMKLFHEWPRVVDAAKAKGISLLELSISAALGLLRDAHDDDDEDDTGPGPGPGPDPDRYSRTVTLYFNSRPTYQDFIRQERALREHFGTNNITDTVLAALRIAFQGFRE